MATVITSECINCGACEPECPNTAIYQGGVEWEHNGQTHAPISAEIFYIVPEKCTECVGFYDHEACAAVCPVDCCVPDPERPESEEALLARARELHPDKTFGDDFPSRFKTGNGAAAATPAKAAAEDKPAAAAVAPAKPAATPPPPAAPAAAAAAPMARVERPLSPPKPKLQLRSAPPPGDFAGSLPGAFEEALEHLGEEGQAARGPIKWLCAAAMPLLGALPCTQKKALERAVGDRRFFSASASTGLNILHNLVLYPLIFAAAGAVSLDREVFSDQLDSLIFLGLTLASIETMWRLREGVFGARPVAEIPYRASVYGGPLAIVTAPLVRLLAGKSTANTGTVGVDGFHSPDFEQKIERERRYGEVYSIVEHANGYFLRMELPRRVPPSAEKANLGVPDEMPDYQIDLSLTNGYFVVKGKVVDPNLRRIASISPAFPPDFTKHIKLARPIRAFKHRYREKNLEVVLLGAA